MFFGKLKRAKGAVHINKSWCKGCGFCVKYCPENVLEMSAGYNAKGYHPPFVKDAAACNNCRFCEVICPEFSIFVTPDDDEEEL
ncbi:MAG: 4Fe-4S ferredoxin [Rhodospirillales bacterium RIFCSPLOWO2_12_FULL_58_28]|nr:MAG: 4Fe-4S ferredoxin [Rhodospirillales bacterium RIFCSPLOWO2_02_FULL_58_16]OHC78515.1 MAG: 4Fe-4S ferredoxin [Rhodospirillales bacterium RIFCSPLOWO2_12_FULL_58_28]